ncbi:MAG: helix-turn-helix transcriptional regulator [Clostridia bacterium]|nr:helix-turn-helix transcriptional regulator [Clostridia bacterium]
MTISTAISKRIDEFLYSRGITLYKLAKDSTLPIATLQNLYRGQTKTTSLTVVFKVCSGLNVTPLEFFDSPLFSLIDLELD